MSSTAKIQIAPNVRELGVYQPGKPIEETRRELGLSDVIKLASNENPLGPSPKAVAAIGQALAELHRYPDGSGFHLRRALSARLGVSPDELILGNGSNEVLEFILRTVAQAGDNVVMGWPSFVIYELASQAAGLDVRKVPMPGFAYDVPALLAAVDARTRVMLIGHPSNPTGTYLPKAGLEQLIERLPESVVLVVDEAYFEYVDAADYASGLTLRRPNVLVLRTFSKVHGLAGLRLGYGVGDATLVAYLNRIREPFNVNSLALAAGVAALTDVAHVERCVRENRRERERITAAFVALGVSVVPSQANFVLVDFGRPAQPIYQALLERGVITRPMTAYELPHALRLSFGTRAENDRLIAAVRAIGAGAVGAATPAAQVVGAATPAAQGAARETK